MEEGGIYREGVALRTDTSGKTLVEAGLKRSVVVETEIPEGTRLTLKFRSAEEGRGKGASGKGQDFIVAEAVSPDAPRLEAGYYWGYNVRIADSLSSVFTECPFDNGYDVSIGTSERGEDIEDVIGRKQKPIPEFSHMLVVFGGLAGLEQAFKDDKELKKTGVKQVSEIFDFWVDMCPGQGSRTIRTEEALWIALSRLKSTIVSKGRKPYSL